MGATRLGGRGGDFDVGAAALGWADGELAAEGVGAGAHVGEAVAEAAGGVGGVEATAVVADEQAHGAGLMVKADGEVAGAAVLGGVAEGFLRDVKERHAALQAEVSVGL